MKMTLATTLWFDIIMCGIIGFFNPHCNTQIAESGLRRGLALMACRGPDDEGVHSAPGVLLGHRRLSIIDLAGGHQPFVDEATGAALVFNGEIFNYRVLKRALLSLGHVFSSESDTEVLLRSYLQWGLDCLGRLDGMFAFAIHDPRTNRLFIARDRLGIKPLFFSRHGAKVMFASACSALRCFDEVGSGMDMDSISHYLTTIRTTLGRKTLFRDIQSLLPGEYLLADEKGSEDGIRRYWEIPIVPESDKDAPGIDAATRRVRELLENSVEKQLISDVPLGGFLSGGIDSSILAFLASGRISGHFKAFGVGYDREGYNEWPFIDSAVSRYGLDCQKVSLREREFPSTWRELVRFKGLPVSTPNEIAICHLARAVRETFTVALSGEGADEIFGGYVIPYFSAYDFERARREPLARGESLSQLDRAMQRCYLRPHIMCRADHYFLTNSWMPFAQKHALLTREAWDAVEQDAAVFGFYEDWFRRLEACSTFDAYMHIHARVNLEGLLFRVDSSTMSASVEARVPFTDHSLVEYLFGLPDNYKMDWVDKDAMEAGKNLNILEIDKQRLVRSKLLLRRAFAGDVPSDIMERPKASFPVPFREWFGSWMKDFAADTLRDSPLVGSVFKPEQVRHLLDTSNQPQSGMMLWPITNLCLWQKECGVDI